MEEYEKIGKEKIKAEQDASDSQINNFLDKLDYRGQQEVAYGSGFAFCGIVFFLIHILVDLKMYVLQFL